jgi:hypothetical protein
VPFSPPTRTCVASALLPNRLANASLAGHVVRKLRCLLVARCGYNLHAGRQNGLSIGSSNTAMHRPARHLSASQGQRNRADIGKP